MARYIGKHICNCKDCKYMGSGKCLRAAIAKYGLENFKKEILFSFSSKEEMNQKEAELVNEEFVARSDTYNLCAGGHGGFGHINATVWDTEKRKILALNSNKKHCKRIAEDAVYKQNLIDRAMNISTKGLIAAKEKYPMGTFTGRSHSGQTKEKMRQAAKQKGSQKFSVWNDVDHKRN